ncbi:MAG: hypothetical protein L3K04_01575 [Thermoplasmata archaeon]|nr:hypothetical protein [Thermoplasmata archaeon]MCI4338107.1 hypothetical protein [Thermoplasmata archaeon]MCI4341774.1 hypothetical protein [Thermoplasmata archaeon]
MPVAIGPGPEPAARTSPPASDSSLSAVLLLLASFATVPLLLATVFRLGVAAILPTVLLTVCLAPRLERASRSHRWVLPALVGGALAIALASVLTGALNGLSDEAYATPAFAHAGLALYTQPVSFDYSNYGVAHHEFTYYVYLPLLTYLTVPGLDYRWICVAAWLGSVLWLRREPYAASALAMPWIALLAANGQNDFVPLFALSLALAPPRGRGSAWAEAVALALKQFANVVVVGYHLLRREWWRALLAVALSVLFLAPFLFVNAGAVYCRVLMGNPSGGCSPASAGFLLLKRNYWLYPTWVWAVFHRPIGARLLEWGRRVRAAWPV